MKIRTHVITGVWLVGQLHAQTLIDLSKQTRNVNFSAASATTPWSIGASLPASCTTGQAYYLTGQLPTSEFAVVIDRGWREIQAVVTGILGHNVLCSTRQQWSRRWLTTSR